MNKRTQQGDPIEEIYQGFLRLNPKLAKTLGKDKLREYSTQIYQSAYANNIPWQDYAAQIYQESGLAADVIRGDRKSERGATGIAQFMPETYRRLKVDPTDPIASLEAGAQEMSRIINKNVEEGYGDDIAKAQQRYNAGGPSFTKFMKGQKHLSQTHHYPKAIQSHKDKAFDSEPLEYTYQGYIDPALLDQFAAVVPRKDIEVPKESTRVDMPLMMDKPAMKLGGFTSPNNPINEEEITYSVELPEMGVTASRQINSDVNFNYFNPSTKSAAIKEFQQNQGLKDDGLIGDATKEALRKAIQEGYIDAPSAKNNFAKSEQGRDRLRNLDLSYVNNIYENMKNIKLQKQSLIKGGPLGCAECDKAQMNLGGTIASLAPLLNMVPGVGTPLSIGAGVLGTVLAQSQTQMDPITQPMQQNYAKNSFAKGGKLNKLSSSSVKVKANNPSQTDSVELPQAYVDHNEVISDTAQGQYVFSDSLLNPLTGNTFAKDAEKLAKKKAKIEKQNPYDKINERTLAKISEMENSLATLNSVARMTSEQQEATQEKPQMALGGNYGWPPKKNWYTKHMKMVQEDPLLQSSVDPNLVDEYAITPSNVTEPIYTPPTDSIPTSSPVSTSTNRQMSVGQILGEAKFKFGALPPDTEGLETEPTTLVDTKAPRRAATNRPSSLFDLPYEGFKTSDYQTWANTNKNAGLKVDDKYGPKTKASYDQHFKEYVDNTRKALLGDRDEPMPTLNPFWERTAGNTLQSINPSNPNIRDLSPIKLPERSTGLESNSEAEDLGKNSRRRDIGDLIQLGALGGKAAMLTRGYDKLPLHQLSAPITQAAYDPARALSEADYTFAAGQNQARNTVSRASMMGNLQQMSANQARNVGAVTAQYDQMNRQARSEYEQRMGQQQAANLQLRTQNEQIRQQDQAQFFNNIDSILSSVGNYGKAKTSQSMNATAVQLLIQAFPDIAPHFKMG